MDYLLLLLVAILSFLVGYFVCQKRFKKNNQENFAPFIKDVHLQNNFASYGKINKELMSKNIDAITSNDSNNCIENFENSDEEDKPNHPPNMPSEQSEDQRLNKMMELSGEEEMANIGVFDEPLESYNDDSYAPVI